MLKLKPPLLITIIVVIVLVILAIILFPTKKKESQESTITSLKDVNIAKEIYGFSAEIKVIKDKTLTLDASIPLTDTTKTPEKISVKAVVNDATKIIKMKFPAEPAEKDKPVFPQETPLKFSDLKVGDKINIAFRENVSDKLKAGEQLTIKDLFIVEK